MIDVRAIAARLQKVESLTWMPSVSSTNTIGRRVIDECIENEIMLPFSIVFAGSQRTGRGRESREWHSPAGRGIYATILLSKPTHEIALLPLETALLVSRFLDEVYRIDAKIKWPNDILSGGKKISGILLEARTHEETTFIAVGIGLNVLPIDSAEAPAATSIAEASRREQVDVDSATTAFAEFLDRDGFERHEREVVSEWRRRSAFNPGDRVNCRLAGSEVSGSWEGIDDQGRALIRSGARLLTISAGDIISR